MLDQKFWAKYFKVYDILNIVIPYQELMAELEKELDLKANDIVLDVGSGTGNFINRIKNKYLKVVGIDNSEEGIKITKSKNNNFELFFHDINKKLPFSDGYFTKIVSNNTIYTLNREQQKKVLSEIYRILKPGGKFVISNVKKGFSPVKIYIDHILKSIKKEGIIRTVILFFSLIIPTLKMFYYNVKIKNSGLSNQYNFFDLGEQKKILQEIGFLNISKDKLVYSNQAIMNSCYKL
ncbi:MAG: hypothetical protein A2812_03410 [Candidatus Staskawiczbacteria bacterium RIFCSPHIGHO2_01_FULL_36_16]|uniref:Methyltransferase domain-containing protein n=1 Tax=Candidatus Staskawiczbacteria bacterium RIFCSPHIGHO2_01_FULL_36_16 TaxID=1802200 RepID=A0A1G2HPP7_9BACT|nr:MAG: hypothetical protein A2812_03410 [Candidatus Staskawiczbacteria bacterium RIFCSPHIGHO2_01_FULL_36_16]